MHLVAVAFVAILCWPVSGLMVDHIVSNQPPTLTAYARMHFHPR
jgi:hypothetical protein